MAAATFHLRGLSSCLVMLAGMLGGAMLFLLGVDYYSARWRERAAYLPTDRAPYDVETLAFCAMEYASHSTEGNDVVFLGDSTCVAAIDPALFEERTGLHAHNLGATGVIGWKGCEIILRSYLQHHPKPRLIVLCVHHSLLSRLAPIIGCPQKCEQIELNAWGRSAEAFDECRVTVSRPNMIEYDPSLFGKTGAEHCNDAGAQEFTRSLAREVERLLPHGNTLANTR